jgi:hypothetical protein
MFHRQKHLLTQVSTQVKQRLAQISQAAVTTWHSLMQIPGQLKNAAARRYRALRAWLKRHRRTLLVTAVAAAGTILTIVVLAYLWQSSPTFRQMVVELVRPVRGRLNRPPLWPVRARSAGDQPVVVEVEAIPAASPADGRV